MNENEARFRRTPAGLPRRARLTVHQLAIYTPPVYTSQHLEFPYAAAIWLANSSSRYHLSYRRVWLNFEPGIVLIALRSSTCGLGKRQNGAS